MAGIDTAALLPPARAGLNKWHHIVDSGDMATLQALLASDVRFRSPYVWTPYQGREAVAHILATAATVFSDFRYLREFQSPSDCALEFCARVRDRQLVGVDIIKFDKAGRIIDFEVIVRPANALLTLGEEMARRLSA